MLYLSSRPNLHLPGLFPDVDKVAHFTEYAALGAVLYRALRLSGAGMRASLGVVLVLIGCLGMGDEYLQSHVPGRSADLHDWAADLLGGTAGALAAFRLQRVLPAGWISRRGREA